MANNRMWLVHKPTGERCLLAKSFNHGWKIYEGERAESYLKELIEIKGDDDNTDFVIEYESDG